MSLKTSFVLVFALLASVSASAYDSLYLAAPVPLRPKFSEWKAAWEKSSKTDETVLTGEWQLVAQASSVACGYTIKDQYDESGIRNRDGSLSTFLTFSSHIKPTGEQVFGVLVSNFGEKGRSQGPYQVDPNEPQFATWAYVQKKENHDGWFEFSCRAFTAGPEPRLICMAGLRGETKAIEENACRKEGNGISLTFKRIIR